jgi:hypothetical protein
MRRVAAGRTEWRSSDERSNEGMKLTNAERIGRSQLIPGVGRTWLLPERPAALGVLPAPLEQAGCVDNDLPVGAACSA